MIKREERRESEELEGEENGIYIQDLASGSESLTESRRAYIGGFPGIREGNHNPGGRGSRRRREVEEEGGERRRRRKWKAKRKRKRNEVGGGKGG